MSRGLKLATAIGAFAAAAVVAWTFNRTTTRLYCDRCAALRDRIGYQALGMSFPGSDSIRLTGLSNWIESHRGTSCTHNWAQGYTDGFWYRMCHYGNPADYYRIWGDNSELLQALERRQRADSGFIVRVVDSLEDRDAESRNFLISVLIEDAEARSAMPASEKAQP